MSSNLDYAQAQLTQDLQDLLQFCVDQFPEEPCIEDWQQSLTQNLELLRDSIDDFQQQHCETQQSLEHAQGANTELSVSRQALED